MKWIKWDIKWLDSTIRDQLTTAERATFHDFVCLAGKDDDNLGSFKIASWDSLTRKLNTPLEIILSTRDKCLNDRISLSPNEQGEIIISILNWAKYQGYASKKTPTTQKTLAKLRPRREEKRIDNITVAPPPAPPGPAPSAQETATTTTTNNDFAQVTKAYENNIGLLTSITGDVLRDALTQFPADWICDAIVTAVKAEKRNWLYCEAILKRWKAEGKQNSLKPKGGQHGAHTESPTADATLRALRAAQDYKPS